MKRSLLAAIAWLACAIPGFSNGFMMPIDRTIPPIPMVSHRVTIAMEDQVTTTSVEQVFLNPVSRPAEAIFVFPVPRGASISRFSMTVNGKEVDGELLEASKARQIYTDIVRQTRDPGLLEYIGNDLFRMRVFPIPPHGEQKVGLKFTSIAKSDAGIVEYTYPIKTDGRTNASWRDFSVQATIKSSRPIQSIFSPTHAISSRKVSENTFEVSMDRTQSQLDRDFQLFYSVGDQDVGLTQFIQRPISTEDGFFLFLINPKIGITNVKVVPRDVVFILDTSGSMAGVKLEQAKKALRYCLSNLNPQDRFAVANFATTVSKYRDQLVESSRERVEDAKRWVDELRSTGGTAIDAALAEALSFRTSEPGRPFTVIFFTDGQPTVGETNPQRIVERFLAKNTANTRVFTFGVGDDVNATMLDQLAEQTRAVSTYVRPQEDIEIKASNLYSRVSSPVMTNLRLAASEGLRLFEIYPAALPDLFQGQQLVVLGRFSGDKTGQIKLTGSVGDETREFSYSVDMSARPGIGRDFVDQLWARRKVGYLLDQIRANGERKELVDEVVTLAKKYGIATPYTSYLIVPDSAMPVIGIPRPAVIGGGFGALSAPASSLTPSSSAPGARTKSVTELARENQAAPGGLAGGRGSFEDRRLDNLQRNVPGPLQKQFEEANVRKQALDEAKKALFSQQKDRVQGGKLGVDLSVDANNLRGQSRLTPTALKILNGRRCIELGGVWIDEGYQPEMATVAIKSQSPAYFRLLEKQPNMSNVLQTGNYLLWVTPSGTALAIDSNNGSEELSDEAIDKLFMIKR